MATFKGKLKYHIAVLCQSTVPSYTVYTQYSHTVNKKEVANLRNMQATHISTYTG